MHVMVRDVSFLSSRSFREVKISLISLNAVDLVNLHSTISPFSLRTIKTVVKSEEEAIGLVKQCRDMLDENTSDIQGATGIKTTLNGPQGHVSARTVASVAMMDTGLQRLYANLGKFN